MYYVAAVYRNSDGSVQSTQINEDNDVYTSSDFDVPMMFHTYEQANQSIELSYRILIPRYLYAMYSIRNKRGIIHKSEIDPNAMDLTILLYSAKWVAGCSEGSEERGQAEPD